MAFSYWSSRTCFAPAGREFYSPQCQYSPRLFSSTLLSRLWWEYRWQSKQSRTLHILQNTKSPSKIHFGHWIESFLPSDVPQLKTHCLIIQTRFKLRRKIAPDGGTHFLIELMVDVLEEHGCFSDWRLANHTEFDDDVLLHLIKM